MGDEVELLVLVAAAPRRLGDGVLRRPPLLPPGAHLGRKLPKRIQARLQGAVGGEMPRRLRNLNQLDGALRPLVDGVTHLLPTRPKVAGVGLTLRKVLNLVAGEVLAEDGVPQRRMRKIASLNSR